MCLRETQEPQGDVCGNSQRVCLFLEAAPCPVSKLYFYMRSEIASFFVTM